nr:Enhancer of polycomb-like protein 1 [Polyrhizophydium stewartii]
MPSGATGSGLRSRKIDNKKSLPIYHYHQALDLDETTASLNRTIPQVATGVEKEEEEEHHLQAALVANHTHTQVVIPTPDASMLIPLSEYEALYTPTFQLPKSLIRFSTVVEDVIGCTYNLDEKDDEWIADFNQRQERPQDRLREDDFEAAIALFEGAGNDKVSGECPTFEECQDYMARPEHAPGSALSASTLQAIYEHWKYRRYTVNMAPLIPRTKTEEMSLKPDTDPYVCFRRREVRVTRKARRGDTQAIERLRKLRDDLLKAKMILDLVAQREAARRESVHLEHLIFEKRIYVRRLKRRLGVSTSERDPDATPDSRRKKKRATDADEPGESTKIRIPMQKLRDAANLVSDIDSKLFVNHLGATSLSIEDKVRKIRQIDERSGYMDATEDPYLGIGAEDLDMWRNLLMAEHASEVPPLSRWRFDCSDGEQESDVELDDDHGLIAHRAFSIAPVEDDYRLLMNRPGHFEQIHPSLSAARLHFPALSIPLQVIRPPATGAHLGPGVLFYSFFKTLVGQVVTVDLKNDLAITGKLVSVDQFLNFKLDDISVEDQANFPHMLSVRNCFIRGSVVRYVRIPPSHVDTQLLQDAARKEAEQKQ